MDGNVFLCSTRSTTVSASWPVTFKNTPAAIDHQAAAPAGRYRRTPAMIAATPRYPIPILYATCVQLSVDVTRYPATPSVAIVRYARQRPDRTPSTAPAARGRAVIPPRSPPRDTP